MAWSPFQRANAGIIWVEQPGDYANPIPTTSATEPDLVRAHTVVLVGYEADDPPMRYLLEVLESDRERFSDLRKVFAFAPSESAEEALTAALWKAKGVEPILYRPNGNDHSRLYDALREWTRYGADPTAWRREQLRPILAAAPKSHRPEDLRRCASLLEHGDASALLRELSPSPDWVAPLSEHSVFAPDKARPGEWIADRLNDPEMIRACVELPTLDVQSIWHIERSLDQLRGNLSPVRQKAWHLILTGKGSDQSLNLRHDWYSISRHISRGEAGHSSRQLVRRMLQPRLKIAKPFRLRPRDDGPAEESLNDLLRIDFEPVGHLTLGEILQRWPDNLDQEVALLRVLERGLVEALEEASDVGHLDNWDRASWDVPSVAQHAQNAHRTGFFPITRTIADLWSRIALKDPNKARSLVAGWENSPHLLLRRIYLFAVVTESVFSAHDAWSALEALDDKMFWGGEAQVEFMRLVTGRWQAFESAEREMFEARVITGLPRDLFSPEAFPVLQDWAIAKDAAAYKRLARLQAVGWPLSAAGQAALDEILGRHPKWKVGPGDREDFAVWHESRWGPDGKPELLAGVNDDALVSEAMRLQREHVYDQGDIWRVLTEADPERAFRALKLEAGAGRFEPVAWRDLLWAASNKGDSALQVEVADALTRMPVATLGELLAPASSWLQKRRESLKRTPPNKAIFLRLWDRLAALAYPREGAPIEEAERGLAAAAINDPAGTLAWTFLDHIAHQHPAPNGRFRREYSKRLNLAVSAPGRAGLLARVLLGRSLAYIESIDPSWAATNLVPCLSWDRPHAAAMWGAFAGGGHVGTPRLFNAVKAPMLDAFAQRGLGEHDLEALVSPPTRRTGRLHAYAR